ncbi:MAG: tryptophan synthase subunit alpha, partial [Pseudohongiellaceae bacterium]
MSRIQKVVQQRVTPGGKLLIPYLVAGDPDLQITLELMHALVQAGADIIELGMPFSDPSSDGAVIQQGSERALASGTTLAGVLALVKKFRTTNEQTAVVLMGYLNPVEIMGYEEFAQACAAAGVDGVLLVDMPPGESGRLTGLLREQQIDSVFLVAPTTSAERAAAIVARCSGYLYYVSLKGV